MKKALLIVAVLALVCAVAFAENLVKFGDMESGKATDWTEEDSILKYDAGKGIDGSTAMLVRNKEEWSGLALNVTNIIDRTKSYYVECWIKLNNSNSAIASISLEFRPDIVTDYGADDWEGYCYITPDIDLDYEERETTGMEIPVNKKEWVKISGVIRPEDMETLIDSHGAEITRPIIGITCYFKVEQPSKGVKYWVDNVLIEEIPNID